MLCHPSWDCFSCHLTSKELSLLIFFIFFTKWCWGWKKVLLDVILWQLLTLLYNRMALCSKVVGTSVFATCELFFACSHRRVYFICALLNWRILGIFLMYFKLSLWLNRSCILTRLSLLIRLLSRASSWLLLALNARNNTIFLWSLSLRYLLAIIRLVCWIQESRSFLTTLTALTLTSLAHWYLTFPR